MIFENDVDVINYVTLNSKIVPAFVTKARTYSKTLCALVEGEDFLEHLIEQIEYIESNDKAKARKKYSRDTRDMFARLLKPVENVFSAIGGTKDYSNGKYKLPESAQEKLISAISNIRDGKSIERYIETQWINLYHTDPAGVQYLQYKTVNDITSVYPTYQAIGAIRNYTAKGQLVDNILFEPVLKVKGIQEWILVDDLKQYTILQDGDNFTISIDPLKTFEHPFGTCPVIINSNLTDKYGNRLSPFHNVIPIAKEYARDLSIKTILKVVHGSPIHFRMEAICDACHGTRKNGSEDCKQCSPTGSTGKKDVTDIIIIPIDVNSDKPPIDATKAAGFISPDTKTLEAFTKELDYTEDLMYQTMWGVCQQTEVRKTATEIYSDMQPQINKLSKYSDVAEWMEWTITEWVANLIDPVKEKDENISLIVYGKRYLLNGIDTIQEKYTAAKKAGASIAILDSIYMELLTVKYKNDIGNFKIELLKARLEPYLHWSPMEINTFFGANEVARKIYFQQWWSNLGDTDLQLDVKVLQARFVKDFAVYLPTLKIIAPLAEPIKIPAPTE